MNNQTRKVGRPRLFDTPEQLTKAIQDYFDTTAFNQYSVTGLALAIGTSRETLDDYQQRSEFKPIVKEAKLIVENSYELSLRKYGRTGDIFALKNFGWRDKTETEFTQGSVLPIKLHKDSNGVDTETTSSDSSNS